MSFLMKSLKRGHLLRAHQILTAVQGRQASHWLPDYKPGEVPTTEEERIKSAKKYNLLPEEYDHYSDGEGHGDYPKLELESVDARDPWYPWDNPELRKDFNEPVNVRIINCLPEMLSTNAPDTRYWKGLMYFLSMISGCLVCIYFLSKIKLLHPVCEKQFPTPGVTHYTFEPDYGKKKH